MAIVSVCVQADPLHTTFAQSCERVQDERLGNTLTSIRTLYTDLVNIAAALGETPKDHANRLILIPGNLPERLIEIGLVEKFLVLFLRRNRHSPRGSSPKTGDCLPDQAKLIGPNVTPFNLRGQTRLGELTEVSEIHQGIGVDTPIPLVQQEFCSGFLRTRSVRPKNT